MKTRLQRQLSDIDRRAGRGEITRAQARELRAAAHDDQQQRRAMALLEAARKGGRR